VRRHADAAVARGAQRCAAAWPGARARCCRAT
jgi:hypothetical protein